MPRRMLAAVALLPAAACVGAWLPTRVALAHGDDVAKSDADRAARLGAVPDLTAETPLVLILTLALLAYACGAWRLRRRSRRSVARLRREATLFCLGWFVLAGSLLSPLHAAGARSFTLHMLEHELLMLVAAPLLAWSRPLATMLWSLPGAARRALAACVRSSAVATSWRAVREPASATALQALALWAWHVPAAFELALAYEGWHYAQHASFLATATLFWWAIARATRGRRGQGVGALCLFVTSLVGGALGALMALSASPWYAGYARLGLAPFGLTPAEDQQLAGLLMWIPGGLAHLAAALWLVASWLRFGTPERPDAPARPAPGEPA